MIDQLWLIPLGFAAGVLGSMIGLGGGIIVVPVLTFFWISSYTCSKQQSFCSI